MGCQRLLLIVNAQFDKPIVSNTGLLPKDVENNFSPLLEPSAVRPALKAPQIEFG